MGAAPHLAARVLRHRHGQTPGWPPAFEPIDARLGIGFPTAEANAIGDFCFLESPIWLGDPPDWHAPRASRLWRFHLHYFTWAWAFHAHPDRAWARWHFERLWRSWSTDAPFGRGDAWAAYPVSLRAWVMCGVHRDLVAGTSYESAFLDAVRLHAGYLRVQIERDIGGNHVVKNLKALIGLAVFLGDDGLRQRALRSLIRQVGQQVLGDGGHFERSASYHCQVLGDLLDVHDLLVAAGHGGVSDLESAISRMQRWLGEMLLPDGDVPLFNDATLVGSELIAILRPAPPSPARLTVLDSSGFVVMRPHPRLHLVLDVGEPCPDGLPAHAHADCLSLVLSVDGQRLLVDTGTSTYEPGPIRSYERSTPAHNTVTVDGEDQTEVWGVFRAGRRARPHLARADDDGATVTVSGSHDGYRHLSGGLSHQRTVRATGAKFEILDEVTGSGDHEVALAWHLAPHVDGEPRSDGGFRAGPVLLAVSGDRSVTALRSAWASTGFGHRDTATVIETTARGTLPLRLRTEIQLAPTEVAPTEVASGRSAMRAVGGRP